MIKCIIIVRIELHLVVDTNVRIAGVVSFQWQQWRCESGAAFSASFLCSESHRFCVHTATYWWPFTIILQLRTTFFSDQDLYNLCWNLRRGSITFPGNLYILPRNTHSFVYICYKVCCLCDTYVRCTVKFMAVNVTLSHFYWPTSCTTAHFRGNLNQINHLVQLTWIKSLVSFKFYYIWQTDIDIHT